MILVEVPWKTPSLCRQNIICDQVVAITDLYIYQLQFVTSDLLQNTKGKRTLTPIDNAVLMPLRSAMIRLSQDFKNQASL